MSLWDQFIVRTLPLVPKPLVGRFARPYIAGTTMDQALRVVRRLQEEGAMATLDILGEGITQREQAERARDGYQELLEEIHRRGLPAHVSVKLTQLGLKLGEDFCLENLRAIVRKASEQASFIRIDMEDSSCTEATLRIHATLAREFPRHVGVALQAYLRRSVRDAEDLARMQANVRLCKGIYVEPYEIAYKDREIIRRNFVAILEILMEAGCYVGIATHDELLVWEAMQRIRRLGWDPSRYEFQMLLGVSVPLRDVIIAEGHRLRVYVPYGPNWYAYSVRRLRENPHLAGDIARRVLGLSPDHRGA
jgi:proline dehydrogenase